MGTLDDTAIFNAVIQHGGFSRAAQQLGLSNGLISRRIAALETELGTTLIKRTTRQLQLTPEGELFWQHSQRIQQELQSAITLIHASAKKPKGLIRVGAPLYFGRLYLTQIFSKFLNDFNDIKIELFLSNQRTDPIKSKLDLSLRGSGYLNEPKDTNTNLKQKLLLKEKIALYANPTYLAQQGIPQNPDSLQAHTIIHYSDYTRPSTTEEWAYKADGKLKTLILRPKFSINDIQSCLEACVAGYGIGKFTELNAKNALQSGKLVQVLTEFDWGTYYLHAIYSYQKSLPKRTRLLLDFIAAHTHNLV